MEYPKEINIHIDTDGQVECAVGHGWREDTPYIPKSTADALAKALEDAADFIVEGYPFTGEKFKSRLATHARVIQLARGG